MANATIIYACTAGGLVVLSKPGTLNEWLPPRMALEGRPVYAAWADPGPPIRVVTAAGDPDPHGSGQLLVSENGGREWDVRLEAPVTAILGLHAEGQEPRLFAGMNHGGIAASVDGGRDWGVLSGPTTASVRRLLPGSQAGVFYIITAEGELLEGSPEEGSWKTLSVPRVTDLAMDSATGDLYATTAEGIAMSADSGTTWATLPGSPERGVCLAVVPGPKDAPAAILVGTGQHFYMSPDGGNWQAVDIPEKNITALARDPERRDRVYAGTALGHIFESGNRGQDWQPVTGASLAAVTALYVIRF